MKTGWEHYNERNYASRQKRLEKSDLNQYQNGNGRGKDPEAINCDCLISSPEIKEEVNSSGECHEERPKEESPQALEGRHARIQGTDQGRCEIKEEHQVKQVKVKKKKKSNKISL